MARQSKNTVDYFPHNVHSGKTMFIVEGKFGNDGYAFWFKVLEMLGSNENHYVDCRDTDNWEFLLAKTKVSNDLANEILLTLSNLNAINSELWAQKIIYSENFIANISDAYNRRNSNCMQLKDICKYLKVKCKHKSRSVKSSDTEIPKVKESIVKDSKENTASGLSCYLLIKIWDRKPDYKLPKLTEWVKDMDLILRVDKRPPEIVRKIIDWCQQDNFWQSNILSVSKLRKQFDQLELKSNAEQNRGTQSNNGTYPKTGGIQSGVDKKYTARKVSVES